MKAIGLEATPIPVVSSGSNNLTGKNGKSGDSPQKIRYPPDDIKIYKTGGKRTASALCPFRGQQQAASSLAETNNLNKDVLIIGQKDEGVETEKNDRNPHKKPYEDHEEISQAILDHERVILGYGPGRSTASGENSNTDETMSHVSDVSDISVISLSSSHIGRSVRQGKYSANRMLSSNKRNMAADCNVISPNTLQRNYGQG